MAKMRWSRRASIIECGCCLPLWQPAATGTAQRQFAALTAALQDAGATRTRPPRPMISDRLGMHRLFCGASLRAGQRSRGHADGGTSNLAQPQLKERGRVSRVGPQCCARPLRRVRFGGGTGFGRILRGYSSGGGKRCRCRATSHARRPAWVGVRPCWRKCCRRASVSVTVCSVAARSSAWSRPVRSKAATCRGNQVRQWHSARNT